MKAAYAELYPEIYGNDTPNTTELIQAIDPFDAYNDQDVSQTNLKTNSGKIKWR